MQYDFKNIDIDTYELTYKNKKNEEVKKQFKRTIEMAEKLENIPFMAEIELNARLSKIGKTKDDFIIKKDDGKGHITYDETNYNQLKETCMNIVSATTTEEIIKDCFGMGLVELFEDMGVNVEDDNIELQKQAEMFGQKFALIIAGQEDKTPSDKGQN